MLTIYLAGPISDGPNPHAWHEAVQEYDPAVNWINPFDLHGHGDSEVWDHIDEIIEKDLEEVRQADAVLLRRIDKYNLCGASMEAREAYVHGVPVIIWNDAQTQVPLFLGGHADSVFDTMEEAADAAIRAAKESTSAKT